VPVGEKVAINGVYVDDIESLAGRAMTDGLRRVGVRLLERRKHDDLLDYLVELGLRMAKEYDPTVGQAFSTWYYRRARMRVIDWIRSTHGRSRDGNALGKLAISYPESLDRLLDANVEYSGTWTAVHVDVDEASFGDALVELGKNLSTEARWALVNIAGRMVDDGLSEWQAIRAAGVAKDEGQRLLELLRDELAGVV
jgi:hypothetical protein